MGLLLLRLSFRTRQLSIMAYPTGQKRKKMLQYKNRLEDLVCLQFSTLERGNMNEKILYERRVN